MTEPYEFSATVAIKKIKEKKLSVHEWISSCLKRIKVNRSPISSLK